MDKNKTGLVISMVVAAAENNAIGKENKLLWHMPEDLKHFKAITTGHTIVMGRKTFESIGRALPNRRNIVITRQKGYQAPGIEVANSAEAALSLCATEEEVFIIGGEQIYKASLHLTSRIYFTRVHAAIAGDAFFPDLQPASWTEISNEHHKADEKNKFDYSFLVLERK